MHFILNAIWSHKHKKIDRLFQSIIKDNDHKLKKLLPNNCECNCNLRTVDSGNSNQCLKLKNLETVLLYLIQSKKHRKE